MKNLFYATITTLIFGCTLTLASKVIVLEPDDSAPKAIALDPDKLNAVPNFAQVPQRPNTAKLLEALVQLEADPTQVIYLTNHPQWQLTPASGYDFRRALWILRRPDVKVHFPVMVLSEYPEPRQFSYSIVSPSASITNRAYIIPFKRAD